MASGRISLGLIDDGINGRDRGKEKKDYHDIIHERGDIVIQRFTASSLVNIRSVKEKAANALIEKAF